MKRSVHLQNKSQTKTTSNNDDIIAKLGAPTEADVDAMNAEYVDRDELLAREEMGESWEMLFCAVMDMPAEAVAFIAECVVYSPTERSTPLQCMQNAYFEALREDAECSWLFEWTTRWPSALRSPRACA